MQKSIQNGQYFKIISIALILVVVITLSINFPKKYQGNGFSFRYPSNLYLSEKPDSIDLYSSKESSQDAGSCFAKNQTPTESPCGYGTLMAQIIVYKSTYSVDKKFQSVNTFTDLKRRAWMISGKLPWTGSQLGISSYEAKLEGYKNQYVINLGFPHYIPQTLSKYIEQIILTTFVSY